MGSARSGGARGEGSEVRGGSGGARGSEVDKGERGRERGSEVDKGERGGGGAGGKNAVKRKSLFKQGNRGGVLMVHRNGFGFVNVPELPRDLFIPRRHLSGAMDGDGVEVEMLPSRKGGGGGGGSAAKISKIIWRKRTYVRGRMRKEGRSWLLEPLNKRLPWMYVDGVATSTKEGTLVRGRISEYPSSGGYARVQFEQVISEAQDIHALSAHILDDLEIRQHFPSECEVAAKELKQNPPDISGPHRCDLRQLPFITIDGESAQDFDDAIHLATEGKNWRLRVAIADVSAYLPSDSPIDNEARRRGTSVYLPDTMVPMLPRVLCTDLCSLVPHQARAVMVCDMLINGKGGRIKYRIYHATIISQARLTYTQVQSFFSDSDDLPRTAVGDSFAPMLSDMRELARVLRELRHERGALNFDFSEPQLQLDKQGRPIGIVLNKPTEATQLIEQFMLEANETTAVHALKNRLSVLFRVHEPPPTDKLPEVLGQLENFGILATEKDLRKPKKLQELLVQAQQHPLSETVQLILLKSMSQAVYHHKNIGHFALNASYYTHFTSPIRRYPDLILHRAISARLLNKPLLRLSGVEGLLLSQAERSAATAEQSINRLYQIVLLEPQLGRTFSATIASRNDYGLNLQLHSPPVRGFMPLTSATSTNLQAGQDISCVLVRASRADLELEFSL